MAEPGTEDRARAIGIEEAARPTVSDDRAIAWLQPVDIPTYPVGEPTPHPMFFDGRVYQGSSGRVYPLPIIESVGDEAAVRRYTAVFLENRLVKVLILPQLGGRIHMAYDKLHSYHFVYFNRVIKPALVGLTGPWISGGIEFNWPQHHRPTTFMPVKYRLSGNGDARVFLGDIDPLFGTGVTTSIFLLPEDARIHVESEVSNRTLADQTFLWWANPAVPVNDEYQAIFPPDVHAVFDHGKRDVSRFPIAAGTYYKVDYSRGVDISYYRNVPVPTSYMAHYSRHDFVGGYDHGKGAGILHSAKNRISPGKKMWTWGTGDFARAWERNLTDNDGPYMELMTGIYTDNQPDFTWLAPGETRRFGQVFYPYAGFPRVLAANESAALDIARNGTDWRISVYAPAPLRLRPVVRFHGAEVELTSAELACAAVHTWTLYAPADVEMSVTLVDDAGYPVLLGSTKRANGAAVPQAAQEPPAPEDAATPDQLYLIGTHLEQYRHATRDPEAYFAEALRRDPGDWRSNAAMARRSIARNDAAAALLHARRAVDRLCAWNANPRGGQAHYYLGLAAIMAGEERLAIDAFSKASWCQDARPAALFALAVLASRRGSLKEALRTIDEALDVHPTFERALGLRPVLLRRLRLKRRAATERDRLLRRFPLSGIGICERWFAEGSSGDDDATGLVADVTEARWRKLWHEAFGGQLRLFIDTLCEYSYAGLHDEVAALAACYGRWAANARHPMPFYIAAYTLSRYRGIAPVRPGAKVSGSLDVLRTVGEWLELAEAQPPAPAFPSRDVELDALSFAISYRAECSKAHYYLGNGCYDRKEYDRAYLHWATAAERLPGFATVHRNLALYLYNRSNRPLEALRAMERAVELEADDGRLLLELDELYQRIGRTPGDRRSLLEARQSVVAGRDDLTVRYADVLTSTGDCERSRALFAGRRFHPWEGGEGIVPAQYRRASVRSALHSFMEGRSAPALSFLHSAKDYPENLGEGKLPNTADNEIDFWTGTMLAEQNERERATRILQEATRGESAPALSLYYNDVPARAILYRGLAWRALGNEAEARKCFSRLRDHGERHRNDRIKPDYFAVSLPDLVAFQYDLEERNRLFCRNVKAFGLIGLREVDRARNELEGVLEMDPNNNDAIDHLHLINTPALLSLVLRSPT